MGVTKEEFNEFTKEMWKRLKMGEKKYGEEYKTGDLQKSILEEGVDLSNYSFMMYLKTKEYNNKIKKEKKDGIRSNKNNQKKRTI